MPLACFLGPCQAAQVSAKPSLSSVCRICQTQGGGGLFANAGCKLQCRVDGTLAARPDKQASNAMARYVEGLLGIWCKSRGGRRLWARTGAGFKQGAGSLCLGCSGPLPAAFKQWLGTTQPPRNLI